MEDEALMDLGLEVTSWANVVLGLGMVLTSYFAREATATQDHATLAVGLFVAVLAAFDAWAAWRGRGAAALWPSVANAVLGAGLAYYLWWSGAEGSFLYVAGGASVAIAIVALYDVWASLQAPSRSRPMT